MQHIKREVEACDILTANDLDNGTDIIIALTQDEWYALRVASLMLADVAGQAPIVGTITSRSAATTARRRAYRVRDEIARISNELGLSDL